MPTYIVKVGLLRADPLGVLTRLIKECGSCRAAEAPFWESPSEPFSTRMYVETERPIPNDVKSKLGSCAKIDDCRPVNLGEGEYPISMTYVG